MKKILILVIILIALLINACGDNNSSEPQTDLQLEGKWLSKYEYNSLELYPSDNSRKDSMQSLLHIDNRSFSLEIRSSGNRIEKQYSGTYKIIRNIIIFDVSGENPFVEEYVFSVTADSLRFLTQPRMVEYNGYLIRMGSFLWGNSPLANEAFVKVEE